MTEHAEIVHKACMQIASNDLDAGAHTIATQYPFQSYQNRGRRYTPYQSVCVFMRDGFIDRYSGSKLINPAALRLLSVLIPDEFPAHPNWKQSESHIAFWELFPTIDHLVPVARGGNDDESNWMTTSMLRNSAKANSLLDDIGWILHPKGDLEQWDGLTEWVIDYFRNNEKNLPDTVEGRKHRNYIDRWIRASIRAENLHNNSKK